MPFMAPAVPFLTQAGLAAASTAGSIGAAKAGEAMFGGNVENAMQPGQPGGGGPQASPAMGILQQLQQQMQQEEAGRQQAIMQMLMQFSQPQMSPSAGPQAVQMESRNG